MQARDPKNAKGVDCSHWNGQIDWAKVRAAGISFAIIKATEGSGMIDDYLQANIDGAKALGLGIGVYHFCRASNVTEAVQEAQIFCHVVDNLGGLDAIDIPPIIDIETINAKTREEITAICHAWLEFVQSHFVVTPMIYSYPAFIDDFLDESLSKYPLWLASYNGETPQDRNGWTEWEFLQYTDSGAVSGIVGGVDMNEYRRSVEELMFRLSKEDAQKIIDRWLSHEYDHASDADKAERHRLADELRKASGLPKE